jgi:hypothetical protein
LSIEIVLLIAALAIALIVALALPVARRNGDGSEAETRDTARSDDRGGRFKRWPTRRRLG